MRKVMTGLLLAGFAVAPALADDDDDKRGRGHHKKWHKVERDWRGDGDRGRHFYRVERDDDDDDDDRWERRRGHDNGWRNQGRYQRQAWREQRRRYVPIDEVVRYAPIQRYADRPYDRPVRYRERVTRYSDPAVRFLAPRYSTDDYGSARYRQTSDGGLFGGGGGILGALLPVVLQSALGGNLGGLGGLGGSLGGLGGSLGGLTGVGGLGGLGNLGGLGTLASPNVMPLDELSYGYDAPYMSQYAGPLAGGYAPASYSDFSGGDGLSSLLLPALLNQGGGLF